MRHHGALLLVACAVTAHSSSVSASSAPSRHTRRLMLRRLRHCAITAHSSASSAPSRHKCTSSAFVVCAVTAHLNRPLQAYSSPLWGPNTMLFLKLLPIDSAPSRHIRSTTSSAPSRRTDQDFTFCAITAQSTPIRALTAQLSSAILSPGLPARP